MHPRQPPELTPTTDAALSPAAAATNTAAPATGEDLVPPAYVEVDPALPCVVDALGAGFVQALAQDRLLLRMSQAVQEQAAKGVTISVSLSAKETLTLEADISVGNYPGLREAKVSSPQAQIRLDNLRTLVRKSQHIHICETQDVEAADRYTGFSDVILKPRALPELTWADLDTRQSFLGRVFRLPFVITGMTGGLERGAEINRRLALAAQHFGIPMGVGSQRIALEHREHAPIFAVKKHAPDAFLIANLGMAQMAAEGPTGTKNAIASCRQAIEMIEADALAIHANVLQEVVQVEGDRNFRGLIDRIAAIAQAVKTPIIVKEVGGGLDTDTAQQLVAAGVAALDVGGKGGTSWSHIEGLRALSPVTRSVAATFRDWGIPTAIGVHLLRQQHPTLDLIATGGLRDGLSAAKAVALGASMAGIGLPLFRAALTAEDAPMHALATFEQGLKTAMICSGARDLAALAARVRMKRNFLDQLDLFRA